MKKELQFILCFCALGCMSIICKRDHKSEPVETPLVNTSHLGYLYTPVTFANGTKAAGIYIYAEAPDYRLTGANGEGYTCVDDVARAAQVYVRDKKFLTDTAIQSKTANLITFLLEMQSSNGYFYNFIFNGGAINTSGITSVNNANWWSWRALQTLTEANPIVKNINPALSARMDASILSLVTRIKADLVNIPQTTHVNNGITVPEWLPAGSGTDQASLLILGLIPYATANNDAVLRGYIKKLADGISLLQQGDATHFPYSSFLSWENTWHAYGNDQAYALFKAGAYLNDPVYTNRAMAEVDNFYPWLLQNGMKSSFIVSKNAGVVQLVSEKDYEQIAYGLRPMIFATVEAYKKTGQEKYADLAGKLAAWFLGKNVAARVMYSSASGRCYDAIAGPGNININSGAESTIEALFTMQIVEEHPAVLAAMNRYK